MSILGKKKSKVSDGVNMASTADIAFLLLIFFLVTTTFPKDKGLSIVLPEPGEEAQVSQKNILIVDVKRGESQQIVQMRPSEIEGLWRQEVSANPNMIAAVKTDPEAPYKFMIDVLDALKRANAERISLQILEN